MRIRFPQVIPVFRIFSVELAREFYVDFLGFQLNWEHRFEDGLPIYMQVSRDGFLLHLSEHHGDGSPGAAVFTRVEGLDAFHAELTAKEYRSLRPAIQEQPWGMREMTVIDPFGNRIRFAAELKQ